MCRAMPFSALIKKKHFLWRCYCGKKQTQMWFIVVCTLIDNEYASLLFSQTFFLIVSACCASLQCFLPEAYKKLIWIMQRQHKSWQISFVIFDIVVRVKANRMWFSVVCTLIDNDTRHRSDQNIHNKFWPLWWRVSLSIKVHTTLNHIRFVNFRIPNVVNDDTAKSLVNGCQTSKGRFCYYSTNLKHLVIAIA